MHVATKPKRWTLDEVHNLPDDGNKYELVHGELFVTPPPSDYHETILARLTEVLSPYVKRNALGLIDHPRAVIRVGGSEVEPDLMVRSPAARPDADRAQSPVPHLVVEVLSDYTRRRDRVQKRQFYMRAGIAEYWILDPEQHAVTIVRADCPDCRVGDVLTWSPTGAQEALDIPLVDVFGT
ncbi:MAG TPA: Uma2 family endonuclease [Gemmatimonadaceae bacterium]|nr:Uma2 family endonuclease [Gemmatimonadaceae bacterium]